MVKYAIIINLDVEILSEVYTGSHYANAYTDIEKILKKYGFYRNKLAIKYNWFRPSVRGIRMLRIEDDSDLMLAINSD